MAMSTKSLSGFGGAVTYGTSTPVEVIEWNVTLNQEDLNSTHLQSSGFDEVKFLKQNLTGAFSAHEALIPNTSHSWIKLALGSSGGSTGLTYIRGRVRFNLGVNNPQDKVTFDHDFRSTGPFSVITS